MSHVFSQKPIRTWLIGLSISTPMFAVLQGAFLLTDYRVNHGHAPRPETPSRGVVIVEEQRDDKKKKKQQQATTTHSHHHGLLSSILRRHTTTRHTHPHSEAPLRILIIGDSLAAGVGMSQSSTPVLPQSIAKGLSHAMNGRPVYWTCIGSPGSTSLEVVGQILDLDDFRAPLISRLQEWQQESRLRAEKARQRLLATRKAAQEWWEIHKEPVPIINDSVQHPVGRWWKRFSAGFQRDIRNLKDVIDPHDDNEQQHLADKEQQTAMQLDKRVTRMLRRQSLEPKFFSQYDITIVLCGLNDLKDSYLPFLAHRQSKGINEQGTELETEETTTTTTTLKGKLIHIVQALQNRMNFGGLVVINAKNETVNDALRQNCNNNNNNNEASRHDTPLIVFPALPIELTLLSQLVPLSWFIVPLIRAVDENKKLLADMYPGLVLFVESPSPKVISDTEAKRGDIWEQFQKEKIILLLNDVGHAVQKRITALMKEHYESLVRDQEHDLYQLELDGCIEVESWEREQYLGSSMIAADGIHPNDAGYDLWGRLIARRIVEHLDVDDKRLI